MKQRADTPTTGVFIGLNAPSAPGTSNSNSGIPAWRVGKVHRMLHIVDDQKAVFPPHKRNTMKPNMKACGQAMITAIVNASLAVALMLLVEFAISGSFQVPAPYLWAGLLIGLVIFGAQFWRQRHLCRACETQRDATNTTHHKLHTDT
ncbi:hypothetical protein [Marinobacter sp. 2_MG-2023]|nr:hypothetical protein [Marinobacter sp. 2_MG-2023]MDO6442603.1 hypothetical protein [Marinobacter sp. 2_MG-2023]